MLLIQNMSGANELESTKNKRFFKLKTQKK